MAEAYVDACCFIDLAEGTAEWRGVVQARLSALAPATELVTSRLSRLECRAKPLREGDEIALAKLDAQFSQVRILEVSAAVLERATLLRARHGFRAPDAIHLASAIDAGAEVFITDDVQLGRCAQIRVDVLAVAPR